MHLWDEPRIGDRESIADLAFLSDARTAALVDRTGTISWYCPGHFDASSVFASILDPGAGYWRLGPATRGHPAVAASRGYVGESLVLRTSFEDADRGLVVTDALAVSRPARPHELGASVPNALVRLVEAVRGPSSVAMELVPRFNYGATRPRIDGDEHGVTISAGELTLRLISEVPVAVTGDSVTARFELGEGERAGFVLETAGERSSHDHALGATGLVAETTAAWSDWAGDHRPYQGMAAELVRRSAVVLQGLTDARTGAVVAAATTSLPEIVGRSWNWDYRYVWLRDLALVVRALWVAACPTEADRFFRFLAHTIEESAGHDTPIVVASDGRRELDERKLEYLAGFAGSRPVRVGNVAWRQRQLDVSGEIIDAAHVLRHHLSFDAEVVDLLRTLAERASRAWRKPDSGMWEARDRERHYTSSKIMSWVALDRAIDLADRLGRDLPIARWRRERDEIREAILARAWSERAGAFAGAFESDELDASVLLMAMVGFLPASDPRMTATIDAIAERLTSGPLVHRWSGEPNGFLLTSYWLVECEAMLGRGAAARRRFERLNALSNDVGLLSEMASPGGELLGNVPQALSHVGLVNAAWRLSPGGDERPG